MTFTLFDIITFALILVSTILGFYRGFVDIVINFLGFVASIALAIVIYPYVNDLFGHYISNTLITSIVSGITSYVASLIIFSVLTSKVHSLFVDYTGGGFDKLLGLVTGFIRGTILSLIMFIPIAVLTSGSYTESENAKEVFTKLCKEKYPEWLKNSFSTDYYQAITLKLVMMLPDDVLDGIKLPGTKSSLIDGVENSRIDTHDRNRIEPDNEALLKDDALADKFLKEDL